MIFDKPVPDPKVKQGDGPIKYIPGQLLDKKDLTLYQYQDNVMVILDYDQKVFKIKNKNDFIYIPHPRLHQRNFVLLPLFEISKTWIYPKKNKKISDLLINLGPNNLRTIKLI